jgi:chromate transporter
VALAGLRTVLREWGRIGCLGFGGPPAHVALLRDAVVERCRWLQAREFEDATAACSLLPGPASTQLAIYCAGRVAGARGAIIGGLAFIVPGLLLTLAIGAVALGERPPRWAQAIGAGAGAAALAVVAQAALGLIRDSLRGRGAAAGVYIVAGALGAALAGPLVVALLVGCGLVELVRRQGGTSPPLISLPVLASAQDLAEVAWTALKVGALAFGGGFVIIPLMYGDAVQAYGWMSDGQFAAAVAFGQLTPGPVTHTVALVGYAAAGLPGALLATAIAFAPSFALVGLLGPRFAAIRRNARARAFLDGAGPAAAGAVAGAAVPLATGLEDLWQGAVAVAAAAALLAGAPPVAVLGAGALAGLALG